MSILWNQDGSKGFSRDCQNKLYQLFAPVTGSSNKSFPKQSINKINEKSQHVFHGIQLPRFFIEIHQYIGHYGYCCWFRLRHLPFYTKPKKARTQWRNPTSSMMFFATSGFKRQGNLTNSHVIGSALATRIGILTIDEKVFIFSRGKIIIGNGSYRVVINHTRSTIGRYCEVHVTTRTRKATFTRTHMIELG